MSNTKQRVIVGAIMAGIAAVAALGECGLVSLGIPPYTWLTKYFGWLYFGFPAVKWLGVAVVAMMIFEMVSCIKHAENASKNMLLYGGFLAWLFVMLAAVWAVGARPWLILLLLMIIAAADIGAWFFGRMIGGDKMWEKISANKTWAGQIAGILCGTFASVMYGLLGADTFMPQLMWIGISISLLSQYGDLTASYIKRKMGIKDFGRILPGHGGMLDRFDGWIYALPLIWLVLL